MRLPNPYAIGAGLILLALAYIAIKGPKGAGEQVGGAVVDFATGALSGGVVGVGDVVGVPRTNETECDCAKREGRTWDASFACPAGDFLKYVFN